jgi:hypothetical protein
MCVRNFQQVNMFFVHGMKSLLTTSIQLRPWDVTSHPTFQEISTFKGIGRFITTKNSLFCDIRAICCLHLHGKSISFMKRWGTDIVKGQKETGLWAVQTLIGGPLTALFLFLLSLYLYPHFPAQFVLPWRWEAVGSLKRWYLSNSLCGITHDMAINFIYTIVTASNLMPTVYTRAHRYTLWTSKWGSQSTLRHPTLWKIPYENILWDTYVSYFPLSTPMSMHMFTIT